MKILLDTNALIDLVAVRRPYVNDIKKLCIAAVFVTCRYGQARSRMLMLIMF